jgi:gliding motility-associated-like protein
MILAALSAKYSFSQTADFNIPSTICVNTPFTINNTSQNATSYYWNFCVADLNQAPQATNLGNPGGNLSQPVFMDYVLYNNNYYGFVVNHYPGKLIRLDFGNSLLNTPTSQDMGNFGGIIPSTWGAEGIQIIQNEGKWYAIIVGGYLPSGHQPRVLKLDFGADLTNLTPSATNWGNIGNLESPHDLHVFKEGNEWYGLTVNAYNNTITRFNFTNSFDNTPTAVNIGGFGLLSYPDGIFATNDNGNWRVFVANNNLNSRLVRLDFGSSLLNTPVATSVSDVGNTNGLRDITLLKFCDQVVGFGVNGTNHNLYRMNFADLGSNPVITNLGIIGGMNVPHSISKLFRVNDDLYAFTTNVGNNSITRIRFGGCTASSTANSNQQTPPAITYNTPGIYNINLTIDDGLPTQASICRQIEVVPGPAKRPLQKLQICTGAQVRLGSATSAASYVWNTGANTDSITVNAPGIYWVETSRGGCSARDSFEVAMFSSQPEFTQRQDACDPLTIQLTGSNTVNASHHYWSFGDGSTATTLETTHTYASAGNYLIKYAAGNGTCADTIAKLITFGTGPGDVILTSDTTICAGSSITLNTAGSLSHCWQPSPVIPNPQMPSPVITPLNDATYHVTAEKTGASLVVNGDFSAGNTLFQTDLVSAPVPVAEGQYFVGANPPATWPGVSINCRDHTTGSGNMMMVNGTTVENAVIWKQSLAISPNTNYAFSFWVQSLSMQNPALLQLSINGRTVYHLLNATPRECEWVQFYVVWNSGTQTSADIAIVNKRVTSGGNDFAIDDISFAPVSLLHESVTVTLDRPAVFANADTTICAAKSVQLIATGAQTYQWLPAPSLSDPTVANPVALPSVSTQYIVTGTSAVGCVAKDTVWVNVFAKPAISIQKDTVICKNTNVALWVTGGASYVWSPANTIDDPTSDNPVASPVTATTYEVAITDANTCEHKESVTVSIRPDAVFAVTPPSQVCLKDSTALLATGGDLYAWSPAAGLSDPASEAPMASPGTTINYQVVITELVCGQSATLSTRVNVLPLPIVSASRSNDIDCSYDRAQLAASGARTYQWTPASALSNPLIANPVATPRQTTTFIVSGTDRNGCKNYDSVIVKVDNFSNKGGYLMPSAFTPNNDGLNDCYGVKYWGVVDAIEFSIFNRWGERVFYTKSKDQCWDGTFRGEKQAAGVYVYMIKANTTCEPAVFRKGTLVLVR